MSTEKERAEFETWYLENNDVPHEAIKRKGAGYAWIGTDEAWEIWQAAQAAMQESLDRSQDKEDAERYRRLRKGGIDDVAVVRGLGAMDYGASAVIATYSEEIDGDDLDAAIDHARRAEGGNHVNR